MPGAGATFASTYACTFVIICVSPGMSSSEACNGSTSAEPTSGRAHAARHASPRRNASTAFRRDFTVPSVSFDVRSSTFSVAGSMMIAASYRSAGESVTLIFAHGMKRSSPRAFSMDSMTLDVPRGSPAVCSAV